jgi:mutator protein MutT
LTPPIENSAFAAAAIHVVAGVLIDAQSRVLIAQRPAGKHMAGAWEFPGGKLEPGEAPRDALRRELEEEIGVAIEHPRPLQRLRHRYSYGEVLLDVWVCRRFRGTPRGLDAQALRWCSRRELAQADLLPADRPILRILRLPARLRHAQTRDYEATALDRLVYSVPPADARGTLPRLQGVLCGNQGEAQQAQGRGAEFVAMREPVPADELAALCARLDVPVFGRGLSLESAWRLGASGVNSIV